MAMPRHEPLDPQPTPSVSSRAQTWWTTPNPQPGDVKLDKDCEKLTSPDVQAAGSSPVHGNQPLGMRNSLQTSPSRKRSSFLVLGCVLTAILLCLGIWKDVGVIDYLCQAPWPFQASSPTIAPFGSRVGIDQIESFLNESPATNEGKYLLGVGKADITGPVVEIGFMGYANGSQKGSGLRQRLYARSFIVTDPNEESSSLVYTILDTQSGDLAIHHGILEGLELLGAEYTHYRQDNVAIIGTHSHSGPGAWLNYLLPQFTTLGFDRDSYQAIVDGAVLSIQRAHASLSLGTLSFGTTRLDNANINRSPFSYLANPAEERDRYGNDTVEKDMTMLRFTRSSDEADIGFITWFPVHGTSMLGNNTLVTGDNKGVAADMSEKASSTPGFVAGFSQASVGDTSPNINGAFCESGPDAGKECSFERSLCGNRNEACHGRGPFFGSDDAGAASCYEIGRRQFVAAKDLISRPASFIPIAGPIRSAHQYVDMSDYSFTLPNGTVVTTCSASLGYSFAAGTTDGPGAFDFKQNNTDDPDANPLWKLASRAIHSPSAEQVACQAPKPILLDAGATTFPYQWAPNVVPNQVLRVGQLYMIISAGEATTMAGRRWKTAVANQAKSLGHTQDPLVVLGGPANSYTHYIATPEEYSVQRYEGASTLYGPNTLAANLAITETLLPHLSATPPTNPLSPGPLPPDNRATSLSFIPAVLYDTPGLFHSFGDILTPPPARLAPGYPATATFIGANPRNHFRLEGTFAAVETRVHGAWEPWKDDSDWELRFEWRRTGLVGALLGESRVTVTWDVARDTPKGEYRIVYNGDAKRIGRGVGAFRGVSEAFRVG